MRNTNFINKQGKIIMKPLLKKVIKGILYPLLRVYEFTIGEVLYAFSKYYVAFHGRLMHLLDWGFRAKTDSFYKHEISLYNWIKDPSQVEFVDGMSLARMYINKGDNVLDLCCGEGSCSYLFFSDIANKIDAVDYDLNAINYAKKYYSKDNINYINENLLELELNDGDYNMVVWTSSVSYFSDSERKIMFHKIHKLLKQNGILYIKTPIEKSADSMSGSKQKESINHVVNQEKFEALFIDIFNIEFFKLSKYRTFNNLNYVLTRK